MLRRQAALVLASCRLVARLIRTQGLPINLLELQRNAVGDDEMQAAARLLGLYRAANLSAYNVQKFGLWHVVRRSTFIFGSRELATGGAESPTTAAKVAFVMTAQTRHRLRELGYSSDAVAELRPAEATALVDSKVPPDSRAIFLEQWWLVSPPLATPTPAPTPAPTASPKHAPQPQLKSKTSYKSSARAKRSPATPTNTPVSFDMSSVNV
jgi:hypothetical protein